MSDRRRAALAVASVLLLAAAVFFDLLFRGRVLFERDIHALFWGQCRAFVHAVGGGAWPVWNALLGFGQPMLANPGAQILYPPTWLNLVLPPETYFNVYATVHLVGAGTGMLVLGRTLRLGWAASATAAALWMLSGPLLSAVDLWQHFAGAAFMPWVVASAVRALERPSAPRALAWGLVQSLQVLTGSIDLVALTAVPQLGFLVRHLEWGRPLGARNARVILVAAGATLITVGTTAALWLPALDFLGRTARAESIGVGQTLWSVRPLALVQSVVPIVTEDLPLRLDVRLLLGEAREPLLSSLYLGMPALALAGAAVGSARRGLAAGAAALVAVGFLVALGRHGLAYFWATAALPALEILRFPAKACLLAAFGFALLGGLGLEAWRAKRPGPGTMRALAALGATLGALGLVAVSALRELAPTLFDPGPENPLVPGALDANLSTASWSAALTLVVSGLFALSASRPPRAAPLGAVAAVVAVLDLLVANHGLNPTVPRAFVRQTPEVVTVLRADGARRLHVFDYFMRPRGADSFRTSPPPAVARLPRALRYVVQSMAYPGAPARWDFEGSFDIDVVGLDSAKRRGLRLLSIAVERDPDQLLRLLQLGGVDHVVAMHRSGLERLPLVATLSPPQTGEIHVYRVPAPLPRAEVVAATIVADGLDAYKAALAPSFDPRTTVLLPDGEPRAAPPGFEGRAEILEERDDFLRVRCQTSAPAHLVVPGGYDPDWTARIDGSPAPVRRANVAFRAVPLPPGPHEVTLAYRPSGVFFGFTLSGLFLLAGLATLVVLARAGPGGGHDAVGDASRHPAGPPGPPAPR